MKQVIETNNQKNYFENLSKEKIIDILKEEFDIEQRVNGEIDDDFLSNELGSHNFGDYTRGGYIENENGSYDLVDIEFKKKIILDEIFISGELTFFTFINVYGWNMARDKGEDKYFLISSREINIICSFAFGIKNITGDQLEGKPYGVEVKFESYEPAIKEGEE